LQFGEVRQDRDCGRPRPLAVPTDAVFDLLPSRSKLTMSTPVGLVRATMSVALTLTKQRLNSVGRFSQVALLFRLIPAKHAFSTGT